VRAPALDRKKEPAPPIVPVITPDALKAAGPLVVDPETLAQLLSAAVARLLSVSTSTLARMVDRGDFPAGELMPGSKRVVKEDAASGLTKEWGGLVRWRLSDVERWVAMHWGEKRADPHA
jgi:predicted DNA-binding transcriptional regulator AlpA